MFDSAAIRRTRLDNGLVLLSERMPAVRTAAIGIWLQRGSRDEPADLNGVAHFVEHMLFKGTESRSTRDIAIAIDAMGGQLDAFTTHEMSGYHARVLDRHLEEALDLLAELVLAPRFDEREMDRERRVILEEIAASEDDPEDVLFEAFLSRFWEGHSLGRPILGTPSTVGALSAADLRSWMEAAGAADLVVAAAGNLDHDELVASVVRRFGALPSRACPRRRRPVCRPHLQVLDRGRLEQVQLYVACEGPALAAENRYAVHVLDDLLGGGVSSRLFQTIREEQGLAYSVYSSAAAYSDTGYLWIAAGTRPENAGQVVDLVLAELDRLRQEPVADGELAGVKDHLKGGLMLSLESTSARMANLARQQIGFGRTFDLDDILGGIDAVSSADLRRVASDLFAAGLSAGFVAGTAAASQLRRSYADGLPQPDGRIVALAADSEPS